MAGPAFPGSVEIYPDEEVVHRQKVWGRSSQPPISFKGAIQTLAAFQQLIAIVGENDVTLRMHLYRHLPDAVAAHPVAYRPGRFEPRQVKRRNAKYSWLTKPRREAELELLKGVK